MLEVEARPARGGRFRRGHRRRGNAARHAAGDKRAAILRGITVDLRSCRSPTCCTRATRRRSRRSVRPRSTSTPSRCSATSARSSARIGVLRRRPGSTRLRAHRRDRPPRPPHAVEHQLHRGAQVQRATAHHTARPAAPERHAPARHRRPSQGRQRLPGPRLQKLSRQVEHRLQRQVDAPHLGRR